MVERCPRKLRAVCLCVGLLLVAIPALAQKRRVPCAEMIGEFDRVVSRPGIAEIDPIKIGKRLEIDPRWVERCASIFGRRVSRPPRRSGLAKEEQDEVWESEELEEFAREEFDTRNDVYVQVLEGDTEKRRRLRRFGADSSAKWDAFAHTHEWRPRTSPQWNPYMLHEKFKLDSPPPSEAP